jgi:hypothetical protein
MKNLLNYLAESAQSYTYNVKFTCKLDDNQLKALEAFFRKYDLRNISAPVDLPDDTHDFYNVHDTATDPNDRHIWGVSVELGMPVSPYIITVDLHQTLGINERFVNVRGVNEPEELQSNDIKFNNDAAETAKKDGLVPTGRLSTDRFYNKEEQPLATNIYGNEYNKNFLSYLKNIQDTRASKEFTESMPLFSWLQMKAVKEQEPMQVAGDFNEQFDTPKPVYDKASPDAPIDRKFLGPKGNFDDGVVQNLKFYQDQGGKKVILTAPRSPTKRGGK